MKAALVSTLAYRPKLMVLDEPFRGLDPLSRGELLHGLLGRDPGHPPAGATIFLSAEDVAEVEAFASHIGYLEGGRLRFSEELAALRARFREIVLTFPQAPPLPDDWPTAWIAPERGPSILRFIETRFDAERTPAEARRRFPEFHGLAANPMPLRWHLRRARQRPGARSRERHVRSPAHFSKGYRPFVAPRGRLCRTSGGALPAGCQAAGGKLRLVPGVTAAEVPFLLACLYLAASVIHAEAAGERLSVLGHTSFLLAQPLGGQGALPAGLSQPAGLPGAILGTCGQRTVSLTTTSRS